MRPEFPARCKAEGTGIIVGGVNYGQGAREHAALAPLYLGIKAVIVNFARIHAANLINAGDPPLDLRQ